MREIELTKVQNLNIASFLYASCPEDFEGLEWAGSYALFLFRGNKCVKLLQQFHNRSAIINAKAYADALVSCKDMVFQQLRERGL